MYDSWLHDAVKNYNFRLRLPEDKRQALDDKVMQLQKPDLSADRIDGLHKEIEEILNTGVEPTPAGKAVADAARKGFYGE